MGFACKSLFPFFFEKKIHLYNYFMEGETTGRKKTAEDVPEDVDLPMQEHADSTKEYVKPQQIKSLYSRWSKKYREGTLQKPTVDDITNDDFQGEENDIAVDEDDFAGTYEEELHDAAAEVSQHWQVDDWVVVSYQGSLYPGVVTYLLSHLSHLFSIWICGSTNFVVD